MLIGGLGAPCAQKPSAGASRMIGNRIVFVVSHDRESVAAFDHRADEIDTPPLVRPSVDKIADKNDLSIFVSVAVSGTALTQLFEQSLKFCSLPVNVSNEVVSLFCHVVIIRPFLRAAGAALTAS